MQEDCYYHYLIEHGRSEYNYISWTVPTAMFLNGGRKAI